MAVPSYDELLRIHGMDSIEMEETIQKHQLMDFSINLDTWEMLANSLEMEDSDIASIRRQGSMEEQKLRLLECWKQRCGSRATYEVLAKALLRIKRTDLAEKVMTMRLSVREIHTSAGATNEGRSSTPLSPASSSGVEDMSPSSAASPVAIDVHPAPGITSTLKELQEDFYQLVTRIEDTLKENEVQLDIITRRFRMLPESIKRHHQRDEHYRDIRRRIMNSSSIKDFFDNLTELKHWSYMMPDTLEYILKDVTIDAVHEKIGKYREKLSTFKTKTTLRDLIGTNFPVPDYCIELTMEVKGWEDKTIEEAEKAVGNMMRIAAYQHVPLGWKGVEPGSMKLTFILLEPIKVASDISLLNAKKYTGVITIKLDDNLLYTDDNNALKV